MSKPTVLATAILALALALPGAAAAQSCGTFDAAKDFDTFVAGDYTVGNTQVQGRVAVGGNARIAEGGGYGVGVTLTPSAARVDLIVGGSLTVGSNGAQAYNGSVTYGTTLAGTISTPNGTLSQKAPPFSIPDQFGDLVALSAQVAGLSANGTSSGPTYGKLTLKGTSTTRNVFTLSSTLLQTAQEVAFDVPAASTVIVNVTGASYSSATYPTSRISGVDPTELLWNFQLATRVQIGPGLEWLGSVLAPSAAITFNNGQLKGQVIGASYSGNGTILHTAFAGCLPPVPTRDLLLTPLCRNPQSDATSLRLSNTSNTSVTVTWSDRDSAQGDTLTLPARTDTYFEVQDGQTPHRITVTSPTETAQATTATRACAGTIVVRKVVSGDGTPPDGPWAIVVDGDNGYHGVANVNAGQTVALDVPGHYEPGTVPIGLVVDGFSYVVTEPDPRGAIATVSQAPVTILDGERETVVVGNAYAANPDGGGDGGDGGETGGEGGGEGGGTVPPLPEPGGPVIQPEQPTLVPGASGPAPGPGLVAATSTNAADLAVTQHVLPPTTVVGRTEVSTTTVRNLGTRAANAVVVREVPQADPNHPSRIVQLLSVTAGTNLECSGRRPVSCQLGTVAPGASVRIVAKGKMLRAGSYRSVVAVSSPTPESNTTNNIGVDGVVVSTLTPPLRVGIRSPAVARAGQRVRYRVSVRAPRSGVDAVQLCHHPVRGLLVVSAPGTYTSHGRLCMNISRLAAGASRAFVVRAVASAQYAGRSVRLPASASSPNRRLPVVAFARTRIVDVEPSGLG